MTLFDSIGIAGSGVTVYRKWLDSVSDNIANMNNAASTSGPAFQERFVIAQEAADGKGAQVGGVAFGDAAGRIVHEPNNPLADADGNVRYPDIDLSEQMGSLIMAQRGYQANLAVVDRAKGAYEAALQLGRSA
ncbi:flagellar basal-body rod protein FlgC [Pilimelia anulata]|uniref:Flagellar basal-body rod protein FlgC n=1 Tax=Pilimelia anulata TaxID=53371 RepID=A0A8J3F6S1_9ACTN|nr:flagellar basal body rod C-terminal domain-containing protein [Pilimelia anulata]GGJ82547.1 flagellar basal-body rod protein FlgC [Pilimelia anulata]